MTYCSDVITQTVKAACAPPSHMLRRSLPGRGPRSLHIVSISDASHDASISAALAKASASKRALKARVMPGEGAPPPPYGSGCWWASQIGLVGQS